MCGLGRLQRGTPEGARQKGAGCSWYHRVCCCIVLTDAPGCATQVDPVTGQTMYITTRVRENNETLVCANPGNYSCPQTYAFDCADTVDGTPVDELRQGALPDGTLGTCAKYAQHVRFMADIERFTLLVEHSVQSSLNEKLRVRGGAELRCGRVAPVTCAPARAW